MYSVGLFVIHFNDLKVIVLENYKGTALLSVLMEDFYYCFSWLRLHECYVGFTELLRSSENFAQFI